MTIDPLAPKSTPLPAEGARVADTRPAADAAAQASTSDVQQPATDSLELSDAARALAAQRQAAASCGADLDPARLRQVLDRLQSGHYDSAEVQDTIARRVLPDLLSE
jgi:hypothetical protein